MSPLTTSPTHVWPDDVLEFARESGVEAYLEPMWRATLQTVPNATYAVVVEEDPEICNDRHITFEVTAPEEVIGDVFEAYRRWTDELMRLVPAPLTCTFRVSFDPTVS